MNWGFESQRLKRLTTDDFLANLAENLMGHILESVEWKENVIKTERSSFLYILG